MSNLWNAADLSLSALLVSPWTQAGLGRQLEGPWRTLALTERRPCADRGDAVRGRVVWRH